MPECNTARTPQSLRRFWVAAFLILVASFGSASAQSTDRDNPTPLASNEIKDEGVGKAVEYYYSFTAGPGEISITVDLTAKAYSTAVRFELLDADSNQLLAHNMNAATSTGAERVTKRARVRDKQTVLLKLVLDSNTGDYRIKLGGAVEFGNSGQPSGGSLSDIESHP